ncbi:MAG TPA: ABC transporter ATP-binding protein [Acidimicrobiales bacterium]|nr:ABC transporter ATP-binding protein [Acidimicrobiales bacterium]
MPELAAPDAPLLRVRDLRVSFATRQGALRAVDGLSFDVGRKEIVGIVGESGSGKSVAMYSMLGLVREKNVTISGSVAFEGREILGLSDKELQPIRGGSIGMIFQDPMTALTPVYTVGWQLAEQIRQHQQLSKAHARERAIDLLGQVGIPDPRSRVDRYPHELSGGMRQRVVIAMALSCNPRLLIADEPTTALDVTTQAQILDLMLTLQDSYDSSIIIITHDMGVVAELAHRVVVMYAGRPVEIAPELDLVRRPRHPYTWGLLDAVPRISVARERLRTIRGNAVSPLNLPPGCAFAPRCDYAMDVCRERPDLLGDEIHQAACWLSDDQRVSIRGSHEGVS